MFNSNSDSADKSLSAPEWLRQFWAEFISKYKAGDPQALQFAKSLGEAIADIQSVLTPTTVCKFVGAFFFCSPCPRHRDKSDAMIIYPDKDTKKTLYFCLKAPQERFEEPSQIPGLRLGDEETLEVFGRLVWRQSHDYARGEAEVLVRYYRLVYGGKPAERQRLESIYLRLFGKKAPLTVLSIAIAKLEPSVPEGGVSSE